MDLRDLRFLFGRAGEAAQPYGRIAVLPRCAKASKPQGLESILRQRLAELEGSDLGVEAVAAVGDHAVAALHGAEGCGQRTEGGVLEGLPGLQHRLLSHHSRPLDLLDVAVGVFTGVNTGGLFSTMGRIAFSKDFEADSDYMGLYMAARAGYDIEIAPNFWRRMAVEHPGSIGKNYMATHPSTPERASALQESIEEIEEKLNEGRPLRPEYK